MRHVSLTCRNHPLLRWSTKSIAVSNGGYNGLRNIFFKGKVKDPVEFYGDMSGVDCDNFDADGKLVRECDCAASELIVAPEDDLLRRAAIAKYGTDE